jgi:transposase
MLTKLYAGIDISAIDATLCCLDPDGKQLKPSQSFENNLSGAAQIVDTLVDFKAKEIHVGLESTSVYGAHLRDYPLLQDRCFAYEVNPALVNGFKRSFPKKPKTDSVDAWLILNGYTSAIFGPLRKND